MVTVTTHNELSQYVLTRSLISYRSVTALRMCESAKPRINEQKIVTNSNGDICIAIGCENQAGLYNSIPNILAHLCFTKPSLRDELHEGLQRVGYDKAHCEPFDWVKTKQ